MGWTGGLAGGRWIFFLHIIILFHQCNNKNIYQQFYCCLRYIFYTGNIVVFFTSPEKLHFGCKKCVFSHSF